MLKCLHPPQENNRNDRSDKEAVFEILPPKMECERGGAPAPSYFYSDLINLKIRHCYCPICGGKNPILGSPGAGGGDCFLKCT